MARRYEKEIEELRDKSDKESNKKALFQKYKSLYNPYSTKNQDDFVKELIFQFEEYIEKAHYIYLNNYNEEF